MSPELSHALTELVDAVTMLVVICGVVFVIYAVSRL